MSDRKIGENLAREWEEEPFASDLWRALKQTKSDEPGILVELEGLSNRGSNLAATFLGEAYLFGQFGLKCDDQNAEKWLKLANDRGSIEAGYWLTLLYEKQDRILEAIELHRILAAKGYAPSMFSMGLYYLKGVFLKQDLHESLKHFQAASRLGHVYSSQWISYLFRTGRLGVGYIPLGIIKWFPATFSMLRLRLFAPNSDKLRR